MLRGARKRNNVARSVLLRKETSRYQLEFIISPADAICKSICPAAMAIFGHRSYRYQLLLSGEKLRWTEEEGCWKYRYPSRAASQSVEVCWSIVRLGYRWATGHSVGSRNLSVLIKVQGSWLVINQETGVLVASVSEFHELVILREPLHGCVEDVALLRHWLLADGCIIGGFGSVTMGC